MNLLTFDLESEEIPEGWDRKSRIGISCAAAHMRVQTDHYGQLEVNRIWYAGMLNARNTRVNPTGAEDLARALELGEVVPDNAMSDEEIDFMIDELLVYASGEVLYSAGCKPLGSGPHLFTWNGTGFDFPAMLSNSPGRLEDVLRLCEGSFDPWLQLVRTIGFPLALNAVAVAMLGEEKLMIGKAAALWPLNAAHIIRYVFYDAVLTRRVVQAIGDEGQVRWITRAGKSAAKPRREFAVGGGWSRVRNLLRLDEPDRSWMKEYEGQFDIGTLTAWMSA